MIETIVSIMTIFAITLFAKRAIKFLYVFFLKPFISMKPRIQKGDWAIITGATSGIGKEYAKKFLESGANCVLISRNAAKLEKVKAEFEEMFSESKIKCLAYDFTNVDDYSRLHGDIVKIFKEDPTKKIAALVNNVGKTTAPKKFTENEMSKYSDLINVNVVSTLQMTHFVLPFMIENNKGLIINISSVLATIPSPLVAVYASTKAFILKFSESLHREYFYSNNIIVQCVKPGYVSTNMIKIKPSLFVPSARRFVKNAFNTIPHYSSTAGYLPHVVFLWVVTFLEYFFPGISAFVIMNYFQSKRS